MKPSLEAMASHKLEKSRDLEQGAAASPHHPEIHMAVIGFSSKLDLPLHLTSPRAIHLLKLSILHHSTSQLHNYSHEAATIKERSLATKREPSHFLSHLQSYENSLRVQDL